MNQMLVWPRLLPGQTVGVCAPAGPIERERLELGVAELARLGFTARLADGLFDRTAFTAGTARSRAQAFESLFRDDGVGAIVCARGGAGSAQILGILDAELVRSHPKILIGYSDITHLQLFYSRLGLTSHYGPMVTRELADGSYDRSSFLRALRGSEEGAWDPIETMLPLKSGRAAGVLRGGCLSLLAAACGTPWSLMADDDTILLVEDVDEPPYRVDRHLLQLRHAGALARVKGIVFGEMPGCAADPANGYTLEDVILNALHDLPIPIAFGLPAGHATQPILTLPLGARVRLDCDHGAGLTILEDFG